MNVRLGICLLAVVAVACEEEEPIPPAVTCPNEVPRDGDPCAEVGLTCHYFTGCDQFFPAVCEASGWRFEDDCPVSAGGGMAEATTTSSTSAATTATTTTTTTTTTTGGGLGGMGGSGGMGFGGGGGI